MDVPYADHLYGGVGVPAAVTGLRRACARARAGVCVCVCAACTAYITDVFTRAVLFSPGLHTLN